MKSFLREILITIILALIIFFGARATLQTFVVVMSSMEPSFYNGQRLMVNKAVFFFSEPQRGDVIIFEAPTGRHEDFIKRVIGVEGDRIDIRKKEIYINGKKIKDEFGHYIMNDSNGFAIKDNYGPVTVPKGSYFVMGDNRDRSYDSRFWGFVKVEAIKGKAFLIYWSWNKDGKGLFNLVRWSRIGSLLH